MNHTYQLKQQYKKEELKGIQIAFRLNNRVDYRYENAVSKYVLYFTIKDNGLYSLDNISRKSMIDGKKDFPNSLEVVLGE